MFDNLKTIVSANKKAVGIIAISLSVLGVGGYAIYDGLANTENEVDMKQAQKENEKGGKEVAKQFKEVADMDLPSTEEVSSFVGTVPPSEHEGTYVEKEYGKNVYEYFILNLLPSTNDSDKVLMVKSGNIKYEQESAKDKDYKNIAKRDMLPISSGTNSYNYSSPYATSQIGFKEYNKSISYGYIEGGVEQDYFNGEFKYKDDTSRTNFRVSMVVYPHKNMNLAELQSEVNKVPIVVEGTAVQPYFDYFGDLVDDEGVSYRDIMKETDLPSEYSSYTNLEANDGTSFKDKKVFAGVGYRFDFVGNVNTLFTDLESEFDDSNTGYKFSTLPDSLDLKIDDNKIVLKKVDKEYLNKINEVEISP